MERLTELLIQKKQFNKIKRELDKEASLRSWEGMAYAQTLVKLVLIELEIEKMEKDALESILM